ncbi:transposase [Gloeobacter kilaueensis JS1]|uniref:Transposase n=1 Tax=Gloeobacter kilaueensis (strain ATCC BAA-2537 / CCAP 1431/1 / ULC 316 / JS1) TaxID=1183438 RepID=U5QPQ2_GLOK1|nr:transposase [Gloeobacter kilaueensis JS1]
MFQIPWLDFQHKAVQLVQTVPQAVERYGKPRRICVDNGPEFVSKELDLWAYTNGVELDFSRPGKPTDNAHCESFNSRLRQECLNQHWFLSVADSRQKLEEWRVDYNQYRPHSLLGGMTPIEFACATSPDPLLV